jgi:tRNA uridine 5-carboxymethylaminomethyl modification enzyme
MFTSRAEYRLSLREDNADWRLTAIGHAIGAVDDRRFAAFEQKRDDVSRETSRLATTWMHPGVESAAAEAALGVTLGHEHSLLDLLKRPEVGYAGLLHAAGLAGISPPLQPLSAQAAEQVEIQAKYAGYIARQAHEVERQRHYESLPIPPGMRYEDVRGLSIEARQKLAAQRPETLGQASRIAGVTPATISLLLVHLKKGSRTLRRKEAA